MTIKLPVGDAIPLYYAQTHRTYYDLTRQDLAPEFEDPRDLFHWGSGCFMQLMAWDPPQLQTDVRCRCLASACALHAQTRPESLSAMNQCHRYHPGSARASSRPPRCARPLPFHLITVNTISAVRQTLSRNIHALALGRHLRQGSVGARRRSTMESSSASRTTRHVFLFSLRCLQTFSHSLTSTAGIPISPLHLYRDPLWRLS